MPSFGNAHFILFHSIAKFYPIQLFQMQSFPSQTPTDLLGKTDEEKQEQSLVTLNSMNWSNDSKVNSTFQLRNDLKSRLHLDFLKPR